MPSTFNTQQQQQKEQQQQQEITADLSRRLAGQEVRQASSDATLEHLTKKMDQLTDIMQQMSTTLTVVSTHLQVQIEKSDHLREEIGDRFDALRKELAASFVLKEVFDVYTKGIIERLALVESDRRGAMAKWVGIIGGIIGVLSALNAWFHLFGTH